MLLFLAFYLANAASTTMHITIITDGRFFVAFVSAPTTRGNRPFYTVFVERILTPGHEHGLRQLKQASSLVRDSEATGWFVAESQPSRLMRYSVEMNAVTLFRSLLHRGAD